MAKINDKIDVNNTMEMATPQFPKVFQSFLVTNRIIAATLKPIATIKVIEARFSAIWFAACGFFQEFKAILRK